MRKCQTREYTSNSKDKISVPKSVKFEQQSSKVDKLDAKIREHSIKSFKSDKLKSFDMFEASFKSYPVKKKPKLISDVHMADKSAREGFSNRFVFDEMPSKTCENTGQGNVYLAEMDRQCLFR